MLASSPQRLQALDWTASPVGPLILGASADAICLIEFSDENRLQARLATLRKVHVHSLGVRPGALLTRLQGQLSEYFRCERRQFDLPLAYAGSAFQQQVWRGLLEIPYGETWSYLQLARRVGDPGATRAVGAANGRNPIAIVIPCHRVINADGALGGYGGGLWRKQILLDLELGQGRLTL